MLNYSFWYQKIIILAFAFILGSYALEGQVPQNVKEKVNRFPYHISSVEALSGLIKEEFENQEDQLAAIFYWIANNIAYDVEGVRSGVKTTIYRYWNEEERLRRELAINEKVLDRTLKDRKAVCNGYTRLFKKLCDLSEIENYIINGIAKTQLEDIGNLSIQYRHSWNLVKLEDEWQFVDVTWAAGIVNENWEFKKDYDEGFFLVAPERFFLNHFPEDPSWLLLDKNYRDFVNLPLYYPDFFNYELTFLAPSTGLIKGDEKFIAIKISGIQSKDNLSYAFEGDQFAKGIWTNPNKSVRNLKIPIKGRNRTYLTFYNHDHPIVSYKIMPTN